MKKNKPCKAFTHHSYISISTFLYFFFPPHTDNILFLFGLRNRMPKQDSLEHKAKFTAGTEEGARTQNPARWVITLQNFSTFLVLSLLHFHGLCINKLSIVFWTVEHIHQCCKYICCRAPGAVMVSGDIFMGRSLHSWYRIKLSRDVECFLQVLW